MGSRGKLELYTICFIVVDHRLWPAIQFMVSLYKCIIIDTDFSLTIGWSL